MPLRTVSGGTGLAEDDLAERKRDYLRWHEATGLAAGNWTRL
jgi:hypothetical protein